MKLWIVYLSIAVIAAVLFIWFLQGLPAGIAGLMWVTFSIMFFMRLVMGKKTKKTVW